VGKGRGGASRYALSSDIPETREKTKIFTGHGQQTTANKLSFSSMANEPRPRATHNTDIGPAVDAPQSRTAHAVVAWEDRSWRTQPASAAQQEGLLTALPGCHTPKSTIISRGRKRFVLAHCLGSILPLHVQIISSAILAAIELLLNVAHVFGNNLRPCRQATQQ
jgi:hypothetical protein